MSRHTEDSIFRFKVIKTVLMGITWMSEGMAVETIGPTLPDIQTRFNSTYEKVARVLSAQCVGGFVGCFVLGMLIHHKRNLAQPLLILCFLFVGLFGFYIPSANSIEEMCVLFGINGIFIAGFGIAGPTLVVAMWRDKVTVPIHALHIGYGLGSVLTPIVAEPYISHDGGPSQYGVPWKIAGATSVGCCVLWLLTDAYERWTGLDKLIPVGGEVTGAVPDRSPLMSKESSAESSSFMWKRLLPVALLQLAIFDIVGGEKVWAKFFTSYATRGSPNMSVQAASSALALFWLFFVLGRIASLILSSFVPVSKLILCELSLNTLVIAAMVFFTDAVPLHLVTCVFGLCMAPMYPSFFGLVSERVHVSPVAIMVLSMGSALGALAYQWVTGYLIDVHGVAVVPRAVLLALLLLFVKFLALLWALGRRALPPPCNTCTPRLAKEAQM